MSLPETARNELRFYYSMYCELVMATWDVRHKTGSTIQVETWNVPPDGVPTSCGVWCWLRYLPAHTSYGAQDMAKRGQQVAAFAERYPLGVAPQLAQMDRKKYLAALEAATDIIADEIVKLMPDGLALPWGEGNARTPDTLAGLRAILAVLRDRDPEPYGCAGMIDDAEVPDNADRVQGGAEAAPMAKPQQLDLDSRALGALAAHQDWTNTRIAEELGCARTSLNRLPRFMTARRLQKQDKPDHLKRGH